MKIVQMHENQSKIHEKTLPAEKKRTGSNTGAAALDAFQVSNTKQFEIDTERLTHATEKKTCHTCYTWRISEGPRLAPGPKTLKNKMFAALLIRTGREAKREPE